MSGREFNRRERARGLRAAGLLVAVHAAAWLLFSFRGTRVAATECKVVHQSSNYCTFEYRIDGALHRSTGHGCEKRPASGGAKGAGAPAERWPDGARTPCFYYRAEPTSFFLEPRAHRWATPAPVGLLAAGSLAAIFAQRARRAKAPRPPEAPPEGGPYRRPVPPPNEPSAQRPGAVVTFEEHWPSWFFGGPFLFLGTVIFFLTLSLQWDSGGEISPFIVMGVLVAYGSALFGAFMTLFKSGFDLLPAEGLLVRWHGLGPLRWREAYDLTGLADAAHRLEHSVRSINHYLVIERPGLAPLRWGVEGPKAGQAHADTVNAFLAEWRKGGPAGA